MTSNTLNKSSKRTKFIRLSSITLPPNSHISRKARFSFKKRDSNFLQNFEQKILFYDIFWQDENKKILLIGPPPRNLTSLMKKAKFSVDGGKTLLKAKFHISLSVMITELSGDLSNAKELFIEFAGLKFTAPIQENISKFLPDTRIIFTISKNNPLKWIRAWADYYYQFHDANCLILFDNGSTNANLAEIAKELEQTKIEHIILISMPYIFGAIDLAVFTNPYWTNFLQNCINSITLRRFAAQAQGLLNCDIDEFAVHREYSSIFHSLKDIPNGLLIMRGIWIEPHKYKTNHGDHRDFAYKYSDPKKNSCKSPKWVIDPKRSWVKKLNIHPYWHWIENRPPFSKYITQDAFFWHFKGINTNWKLNRNMASKNLPDNIIIDQELVSAMSKLVINK